MKRIIHVVCLVLLSTVVVACSGDNPSADQQGVQTPKTQTTGTPSNGQPQPLRKAGVFRSVTPQEAQRIISTNKDLLVVDVRSPQELRDGFIAGSALVPFWEIAKGQKSLPSDRPLLLVCAVGGRSYAVGQFLKSKGYPEVYNLQGGISAWKKAGLPLQYK